METALLNIFDLPMVLAIFLCLLIASVLIASRIDGRHLLLASYLCCMAVVELDKVIFWAMPIHQLFAPIIPFMFVTAKCVGLFVLPLLYLYIRASNHIAKPDTGSKIFLLIILASGALLSWLLYLSLGGDPDQYLPSNYRHIFFNHYFVLLLLLKYGLFFALVAVGVGMRLEPFASSEKSSLINKELSQELKLVVFGGLLIYSLEFVTDFLAALKLNGVALDVLGIVHNYLFLFYVCLIFIHMLSQRLLKSPRRSTKQALVIRQNTDREVKKIHQLMMEKKYYLDSEISLGILAKKLKMPEHQLSIFLNKTFKQNFFEFVNRYRMEHAKTIMSSPTGKGYSILKVLHESGFNSKSAFNRTFKKHTGITPSEYKEKLAK